MSRLGRVAALAAMLLAAVAAPAGAHAGNPNYRSVLDSLTPNVPGLQVQVLGYDNELQLTNRTGRTVEIEGYESEPYARVLPDGTVQLNERSPAVYLNEDRFGTTPVPATAKASLPPIWRTQDKTGRFIWHDHRMHWMSTRRPPMVIDTSKKTKIFNYRIPLKDGTQKAAISGTLFWVGSPSSFPVAAVVSLGVIALLAIAAVVVVRRRRGRAGGPGGTDGAVGGPGDQPVAAGAGDATAPAPDAKEAW
jgi:hypothetical protein